LYTFKLSNSCNGRNTLGKKFKLLIGFEDIRYFNPQSQGILDSLISPITYPTLPIDYGRKLAAIFIYAKLFTMGKQIL
jgi:hypothetical protein